MTDADATPAPAPTPPRAEESAATGADASPVTARHVVLVHGAYADGSSWAEVIPILQAAGLEVTSVQNPLTSLDDDVAATRRAIDLHDGPTVLVGHSWAGTVISQAGDDPRVSALVYVAARAPDAGEDYGALAARFPTPPASAGIFHSGGFAQLGERAFLEDFAGGVDPVRARVLYAVQGRIADTLFASRTTVAAWRAQAVLVRGVEAGSHDLPRPRAIRRTAHGRDDHRGRRRPPGDRDPPRGDRGPDPRGLRPRFPVTGRTRR